jgi:hypothetical protein
MTTKHLTTIALSLALSTVLCSGCKSSRQHQVLVVILDLTASTESDGRAVAFESVQRWFTQKTIHRGDTIIIIPITGDALTETQGKILRFEVSETRSNYDQDLRDLAVKVSDSLKEMEREAKQNPYKFSDVLGAFRLASEELGRYDGKSRRILIALTDFIQDDQQASFKSIPQLANNSAAIRFARELAESHPADLNAQMVYLGWLRSSDLKKMAPSRRDALAAFWKEYIRVQGARHVIEATDGPGGLDRVIKAD